MKNILYLCIVNRKKPPCNPPDGDGLADKARNLLTGNPLRWAVLHKVRPYSGGERRRTTENGGKRRKTAENGGVVG